jgi:hypothetical protein
MRPGRFVLLAILVATHASAQSLFIDRGQHAAEGSIAWSVGPFSNGVEVHAAVSLGGRWDVGFGFNRYLADFGGADDTTLTEWTPFVRYFIYKESDDGTPVSLVATSAFFVDDFEGGSKGWYALAGAQLFKRFALSERFAVLPYVGFSLAGESFSVGGGDPDRSVYLTRQFGVHGQISAGTDAWLRVTVEEHSFRRETYRAVRAAYVRRF